MKFMHFGDSAYCPAVLIKVSIVVKKRPISPSVRIAAYSHILD